MTAAIQDALDNTVSGTVLLKAGTYNVEGELYIRHSNVVLRGEGENTVIIAKGKSNLDASGADRDLIRIGDEVSRSYKHQFKVTKMAHA